MKKNLIFLSLMLAATFTLTNCTQEIVNPDEEYNDVVTPSESYPYEITASTVDTKTVIDGFKTSWAEGDKINLFHAVGETDDYKNNGAFTVKDVEEGVFTGNLCESLDSQEEYDWYALYPYNSNVTTPAEQTVGYTYIGYKPGLNQTGYNSTASLKGSVCPLYGVLTANPAASTPSMTMNHLAAVVEINVTNKNDEPLTVTTASLTAEEDLVGSYYIDITKSPVAYTPCGDTYVSKIATVNVKDGTALAKNQSATLYLAIKPFTAKEGQKLTLSVNGYSKEITMSKDVTFTAGKVKTLNFAYEKTETALPEEGETVTVVASELGLADATVVTSLNNGLLTFNQGDNTNNAPKFYTNGSAIRMYTGNTLKVSAPVGHLITRIAFTFVSTEYSESLSCTNSIGYSNGTWTGELDKVEFRVSGASQARITKIVVEYKAGEGEIAEITSIAVDNPKVDYIQGTDFVEPKVFAIYSNGTTAEVSGATFSGYDLSSLGEQTVTVTYEEFTTLYTINVSEPAGDKYSKYSGEIVEGDYIIVYDGVAMNTTVTSSRLQYTTIELVEGNIVAPKSDIVWHIAKSGDYWTLYNAAANKYAASTGVKNKAQMLASGTDDKSLWTVSGTTTYEFVNKKNKAEGVNENLRRNTTYGFACYSASTGGALTLYKKN